MERDLFGEPTSEKKRRRRSSSPKPQADSSAHQARQLELAPPAPGLDDLVARLKPLHHRLEADLARTLERDTTLQQEVSKQCEALSRQQGVAVSEKQYVHTAATVCVLCWVARLTSLPEEAAGIADPDVREGLRSIIGDVEPYPYVVMG